MSKGKKGKKKPKLAAGAVLGQLGGIGGGAATPQRPADEAGLYTHEDKAKRTVGSIPIIGGLTGAVMGLSAGVRGEGTSVAGNFASSLISPTAGARSAKDAGLGNMGAVQSFVNPVAGAILTAKARKKQMAELAMQRQVPIMQSMIANSAGQGYAHGGTINSGLQPLQGGELEPISKDAVQVKANNPTQEDSVELQDAYVDHNEVIDKKDRVFSDIVTTPSGRTVAKEAKRLEKMKNNSSRFADSNARIDGKLDDLFTYQESVKDTTRDYKKQPFTLEEWRMKGDTRDWVKNPPTADEFKSWGEELNADRQRRYDNMNKKSEQKKNLGQQFINKPKKKFVLGGLSGAGKQIAANNSLVPLTTTSDLTVPAEQNLMLNAYTNFNNRMTQQANTPTPAAPNFNTQKKGFLSNADWGQIGVMAATAAPNIANAFLQSRLKGPRSPQLETDIRLNRMSAEPELAAANRAYSQAKQVVTSNTGQGANLSSSVGNLLAKRLAAQNQTYGNINSINAQIGNQESLANQAVRARNIERSNRFSDDQTAFRNRKLMMTSENIANLSGKIQMYGKERNMMERDRQAFEFLQSAYGDSGVLFRLRETDPELFASVSKALGKKGNKMGGKLSKKRAC